MERNQKNQINRPYKDPGRYKDFLHVNFNTGLPWCISGEEFA